MKTSLECLRKALTSKVHCGFFCLACLCLALVGSIALLKAAQISSVSDLVLQQGEPAILQFDEPAQPKEQGGNNLSKLSVRDDLERLHSDYSF